ncbi:phage tail protein I [Rahnella sp. RcJ3]|jgi:phage tail P2-like protein|uniref:phage tail protein I n=1 Tax=Rahnella sp. RcJ3 TaxID=2292446 RepID=UPI001295837A|nr:phage tail protein I [Rahnella sp. RcJ3]MQB54174.1 phage tail protein I [Rahnella sp. RcJ3]
MSDRLLPSGSTQLEVAATQALSQIGNLSVPLRELWDPDTCPLELLPYLAWSFSVDRWDENWTEPAKRSAVSAAWFVHKHKGTIGALRRVVEPLGYLIRVTEWWQTNDIPGTFRLDVGVLETGITEEMYQELERLITDAKPCSRHLNGLSINLDVTGDFYIAAATYDGEELTVYPYFPETITASGSAFTGSAIHLIDNLRVNYDS